MIAHPISASVIFNSFSLVLLIFYEGLAAPSLPNVGLMVSMIELLAAHSGFAKPRD